MKALAVLLVSFAYLAFMAAPDVTWINTDSDAGTYLWSTKNLGLSHPTGAPLYNIVGHFLTLGTDDIATRAYILSLLSAFTSALTAMILWLETRKFIAPAIFLAVGLVVSQSTIIETYGPITLTMVLLYYWRDKRWLFLVAGIAAIGLHHLAGLALLPLVVYRRKWSDLLLLTGALWYSYFWLAVRPAEVFWAHSPFMKYFFSQNFLLGGLDPSEDGWLRIQDFTLMFFGGLGITALLLPKVKDKLLWILIAGPFLYYATNLAPQTYVYAMPGFAFIAIAVSKIKMGRMWRQALAVQVAVLLLFNLGHYDIGRNLDPSPTSARAYLQDLENLPKGSVVYANRRSWETVLSWNLGTDVLVVSTGQEIDQLGVWPTHISLSSDPSRYSSVIVPCDDFPACYDRFTGIDQVGYLVDYQ